MTWLRLLSGVVGAVALLIALMVFVIGGVMSPDSSDGCSPPVGDIQEWLSAVAALGLLCAGATSVGFALTGGKGERRATILLGAGAVALTGAWVIYLSAAC